jgi:hypothetical protein
VNLKPRRYLFVLSFLALLSSNPLQAFPGLGSFEKSKHPGSDQMAEILGSDLRYHIFGTGGIKVSMPRLPGRMITAGDVYEVYIDGSALSNGGLTAEAAASDFEASAGKAYFVSAPASCLLPSAAQAAGKEILVCNKIAAGSITYITTSGQTISGHASGTVTNNTPYKIDRLISDGYNWYKE